MPNELVGSRPSSVTRRKSWELREVVSLSVAPATLN